MLALGISGWLLGMVVAQYLRIFAVIPLALGACVLAAMIGVAQGHTIEFIILACILIVVSLQFGFFVGALLALPEEDRPNLPVIFKKRLKHLTPRAGGQEGVKSHPILKPGERSN